VMLIDQNDAKQFKERLIYDALNFNDQEAIKNKYGENFKKRKKNEFEFELLTRNDFRNSRIALYDLSTGIYVQGKERIDGNALEDDPQFQVVKVQAKFLQGEINYSKSELLLLKDWFKSKNILKLKQFFEENIIPWAQINSKDYSESDLAHLFQKDIAALPRKKGLLARTFGLGQ